jgi:hypothetical protein
LASATTHRGVECVDLVCTPRAAVIRQPPPRVKEIQLTTCEPTVKKLSLIVLMSLGMASAAFAQTATGGVTMSTDPAKIAAVEKHAQELKARPAPQAQAKPAAKHATKTSSTHKAKPQAKTTHSSAKPVTK